TTAFRAGETFSVPRGSSHELIVVWLHLKESFLEKVRTVVFHPSSPILVTTGHTEFRVATPQVAGLLLLRVPQAVGWAPQCGGGVVYKSLQVNRDGTATFSVVPLTH